MKKCFLTQKGPKALGPYSTANIAGGLCFISGMLGTDPESGKLPEGVEAQAKQSLANLGAVLGELGLTPQSVLKTTVFLQDLGDFGKVNTIYADFFGSDFPARSCVEVAKLPMNALVEIEAIASVE